MVVPFSLDWIGQQLVIACRGDLLDQIREADAWEILDKNPLLYFAGDEDIPPSMVMLGFIEVSVKGELAFDLRNLTSLREWSVQLDEGGERWDIVEETQFIQITGHPATVTFFFRGNRHTVFKLFYEEESNMVIKGQMIK